MGISTGRAFGADAASAASDVVVGTLCVELRRRWGVTGGCHDITAHLSLVVTGYAVRRVGCLLVDRLPVIRSAWRALPSLHAIMVDPRPSPRSGWCCGRKPRGRAHSAVLWNRTCGYRRLGHNKLLQPTGRRTRLEHPRETRRCLAQWAGWPPRPPDLETTRVRVPPTRPQHERGRMAKLALSLEVIQPPPSRRRSPSV